MTVLIALVLGITSATALCVDNDGGALSYTKSSVTVNGFTYSDYCIENGNVAEFTCDNGELVAEEMPCLLGCRDGACKPTAGGSSIGVTSTSSDLPAQTQGTHDVPEFSVIAAGVALSGASIAYLLMRNRE